MEPNIIVTDHGGIVCDNPKCDFQDSSASFETFHEYLNRPCPKCGENLLTQGDYENAMLVWKTIKLMNTLTPDQIQQMNDIMGIESNPEHNGKMQRAQVSTHNGITFNIVDKPE